MPGRVGEPAAGVVGRAAELAAGERLLERCRGGPAGLLLEGPAGIGKTVLWQSVRAVAAGRGHPVLWARPTGPEAAVPLAGFGDLFGGLPARIRSALPSAQRRALEVALLLTEPDGAPPDQRAVGVAVVAAVRALAGEAGPVLIAVDDAHWLDPSSAEVLAFALRRLGDRPVAVLLAARPAPAPGVVAMLRDALPPGRVDRQEVGPMAPAALRQVLAEQLPAALPRGALGRVERAAGGNPLFALEIGRALAAAGGGLAAAAVLPVAGELAELTGARVAGQPAPTRAALLLAALAAGPHHEVLVRAGVADPAGVLAPAVRDGIVEVAQGRVRFRHPLLAEAVVARADEAERRAAHRVLAAAESSAEARARHAGLAGTGRDEEVAAALAAAAVQARRRGAPDAAAELFELAHERTASGSAADWLVQAARCAFESGDVERAAGLADRVAGSLAPGPARAVALQLRGQVAARSASFRDAAAFAAWAVGETAGDRRLRAAVEVDLAFDTLSLGDFPAARRHALAAESDALAAGPGPAAARADRPGAATDGLLAEALACRVMVDFLAGAGLDRVALDRAVAGADPERGSPVYARPRFVEALVRLFTGELRGSQRLLDELAADSLQRGREAEVPYMALYRVWGLLWRGEPATAAALAEQAVELSGLNPDPVTRAMALTAGALVDAHAGDPERAVRRGGEALELFRGTQWMAATIWPSWAMGMAELAVDHPERTARLLAPLAELVTGMSRADPILGIFLPDQVQALVALGRPAEAARLVDWLAAREPAPVREWVAVVTARGRAAVAAAQGRSGVALAELDRATAAVGELAFEGARLLLLRGQVHRRRREKGLAATALRAAAEQFDALGSPAWARQARAELRLVGLRRGTDGGLTATERRVAELAASGRTNREVAAALLLAPKTVGNVLGRVYRKLGIRSRAELGRRWASADAEAGDQLCASHQTE